MESEIVCHLCSHVSRSVKEYVTHCQLHSNQYKVSSKCPVRKCKHRLSSYTGLKAHLYRDHRDKPQTKVNLLAEDTNTQLQCKISMCQQICDGMQQLLKHLRQHIEQETQIECQYTRCSKTFTV